ncbi:MAG: hypothetical protein ABI855_00565 [Bacteroidota bacterium]
MKKIALVLIMLVNAAYAQQEIKPIKINMEFNIDETGNAKITSTMTMNAAQWDNFKRSLGINPSLLKRQMERSLPGYFLSDFDYKEDVMNRSFSLAFNAYGMCKVDESGKWYAEWTTKNPDVTKLTDNTYMIITDMSTGGQIVQANQKINFPSSASDIKQEKDAFGKTRFTFNMSSHSGMGKMMQYGGIGLIVLGIFFGWRKTKSA